MKAFDERMRILRQESEKTMSDAKQKLNESGRVMIVRPTGFGKTYLLVHLAEHYVSKFGKKVLYLYPNDIIRTEIKNNLGYDQDLIDKYFDFESYQTISLMMGDALRDYSEKRDLFYNKVANNYSVILLDEVHRCASTGFTDFYDLISDLISSNGTHMVGVTATPNRMLEEESLRLTDYIFQGNRVYKYDLGDAFRDGLLLEMIYGCREYDMDALIKEFKDSLKGMYSKNNKAFNDECFNMEISKLYKENGTEPEFIYEYIKKAGYNLASSNPDNSYLKFIVFFSNAQDIIERSEQVEEWFIEAVNGVARNDLGFKEEFTYHIDYVISSTADANADYGVKKIASKSPHRSYITNASKIGENDTVKARHIDLIFNINVINMGYHVDNISGIVMLRATKSEIIYYQQLGRCLSVKATKHPIVLDFVRNLDVKFDATKRKKDLQNLLLSNSETLTETETCGDGVTEHEGKDYSNMEIFITGHKDAWEDFKNRWSDVMYSDKARVVWLYQNRHCPLCVIAQDLDMSCSEVAKMLTDSEIELRQEDAMYKFYEGKAVEDNTSEEFKLMKYIYSRKARELYSTIRKTTQSVYTSVLRILGIKEK